MEIVSLVDVARDEKPAADANVAGRAIHGFGVELFKAALDGAEGNVIVSPASVAIALSMLEPGVVGTVAERLRELLRIEDVATFHESMNALEQSLQAREAGSTTPREGAGEVTLGIANAAYLQNGYPFHDSYLDTVGRHYGPVVSAVDFRPDPDAVAHEINRFVAEATRDRITDLLAAGVLDPETVLVLVNALYLKASWVDVFHEERTAEERFTRLDGTEVGVPMMHGKSSSSGRGDGWVTATKSYVGGLAVQFILPDAGRFDEVAARLGDLFAGHARATAPGAELGLPRFEARFSLDLSPVFKALGLGALYQMGSLMGIADDERLALDVAVHQTFVAMDEKGTEAAAATALAIKLLSARPGSPVPVILDRPFFFRIFDRQTGATLFVGRVLDPTT